MKTETKTIQPEILLEEYRRLLEDEQEIEALPLIISGNSMSPFLIHGRDTAFLSRLTRPARRGDILLYQRKNGAYVLHRVHTVTPQGLTMVGDAQDILEPGIQPDQIIAIVTRVVRKGKELKSGSFWWDFFEKVWIRMVPIRSAIWGIYSAVGKSNK